MELRGKGCERWKKIYYNPSVRQHNLVNQETQEYNYVGGGEKVLTSRLGESLVVIGR
jgi:hypothetical protein